MDNEKIVLSLGSNVEPKKDYIKQAVQFLRNNGIVIEKISSTYLTQPVEFENQPDFLNLAIVGNTFLSPFRLLKIVKSIEKKIGRKKSIEKGPREIDIDIVFYGQVVLNSYNLQIPHKSYKDRKFVLNPIAEIFPEFIPPNENNSIFHLNNHCKDLKSNPVKI